MFHASFDENHAQFVPNERKRRRRNTRIRYTLYDIRTLLSDIAFELSFIPRDDPFKYIVFGTFYPAESTFIT